VLPDLVLGGLLRAIRIEDQQRQRRGQFRLTVRHLVPRMVAPMMINMPGAGGRLPKKNCNAAHSRFREVVRDYFLWVV
jgi:hypothetical protein